MKTLTKINFIDNKPDDQNKTIYIIKTTSTFELISICIILTEIVLTGY